MAMKNDKNKCKLKSKEDNISKYQAKPSLTQNALKEAKFTTNAW